MNDYVQNLYNDLMNLCGYDETPFSYVDHEKFGQRFRVFRYRLATYSDWMKPNALECRGHMFRIDDYDNCLGLVSLPPQKFFNNEENPITMGLDFSKTDMIMDKMDGSLMTTYFIDDVVRLKSKTQLDSEMAIAATNWLHSDENINLYNFLKEMCMQNYSVSLEFTSPKFRIVLPYQQERLTVLCARDMENGDYLPYDLINHDMVEYGCDQFLVHNYINEISPDRLKDFINNIPDMGEKIEGYVLHVGDKFVKIKLKSYQTLHRNKDTIGSPRNLFECVVRGSHDDLRGMFHDDQYVLDNIDKMEKTVKQIYHDYDTIPVKYFHDNQTLDRKSYAIKGLQELSPLWFPIAMALYSGKTIDIEEFLIKHYKDFNIPDEKMASGLDNDSSGSSESNELLHGFSTRT